MRDPRIRLSYVHSIRLKKKLDAWNNLSDEINYHKNQIMMINCAIQADRVFAVFWIGVYLGV
jgi:hypothetical protein